jgi:hypothetical protein
VPETRLQRSSRERLQRLRARTIASVVAADTASTTAFVDTVVPIVLASQRAAVAETDAYMSMEAGLATSSSTDPWGIDPDALIGARARRGDWLEDVYARNHRAAASSFAARMAREVDTDITLANRATSFVHTEGDDRITGYRRTLGGGKNCGLCVAAATRRYRKADLQPIHSHCRCGTQPIYAPVSGWTKPNKAQLNELYRRAGGSDYQSLRRIQVPESDLPDVLVVDSKLGPTLVRA